MCYAEILKIPVSHHRIEMQPTDSLIFWKQYFAALPWQSTALFVLAGVLWIVGGNVIHAHSMRRRGEPPWSWLLPHTWLQFKYTKWEWLSFVALFIACNVIFSIGTDLIRSAR